MGWFKKIEEPVEPLEDPDLKLYDYDVDDVDVEVRFDNGGLTTDTLKKTFVHEEPPPESDRLNGVVHVTHFGQFRLSSGTNQIRDIVREAGEKGAFILGDVMLPWSRVLWVKIVKRRSNRITLQWKRCDACSAGRCLQTGKV
jgi:hypothetical protein